MSWSSSSLLLLRGCHSIESKSIPESIQFSAGNHLRDFNTDLDTFLTALDPAFSVQETTMYQEHIESVKEEDTPNQVTSMVDEKVSQLAADARRAQYDADSLALARDVAQVSNIHKALCKSEQAARNERLSHFRAQNTIGAALVAEFMAGNMSVHSGTSKEMLGVIERVHGLPNSCSNVSMLFLI